MRELGLTELELGNEVYYHGSTADEYAAQYRAAHEALAGSGISLIADAVGRLLHRHRMVPGGKRAEAGLCVLQSSRRRSRRWSGHFYGSMNADGPLGGGKPFGWATVPRMIADLKKAGDYAPLNITEVGQPTYQGTDGNTAVTEAEQAADVKQYLTQAAEWGTRLDLPLRGHRHRRRRLWPLQMAPASQAIRGRVRRNPRKTLSYVTRTTSQPALLPYG